MSLPKALNPIGNKIPFSVAAENYILQTGSKAIFEVIVDLGGFPSGSNFKLSYLSQIWQFNFVDVPDNTGTQLTAKPGLMSMETWFPLFINEMKVHPWIAPYYDVSMLVQLSTYKLIITAKNFGYKYTIHIAENNWRLSQEIISAGIDQILRTNFGIQAQLVTIDDLNITSVLGEDWISGINVEFDFHQYLALAVSSELYFPQNVLYWKKKNQKAIARFFIRYWEKSSNFSGPIKASNTYKAIQGGLTKLNEKLFLNDDVTYLNLVLSGDLLIQTNRPEYSTIHYNQPLQFYFINHFAVQKVFQLWLLVGYTDGHRDYAMLSNGNTLSLNPDEQGCFIITPSLHSLKSLQPNKTLDYIMLKLTADDESLTSFGFVMHFKEGINPISLYYKNSFDVWDSTTFFGITEIQDNYERIFFKSTVSKFQQSVFEQTKYILNSGWISADERDSLRDLLRSDTIYIVAGNNLLRVNILNTEFKRHIDKEYLKSLQIEVELSDENQYYLLKRVFEMEEGILIGDAEYIISDGDFDIGYK